MLGFIALLITLASAWIGYGAARRFVRDRLRYVDSALRPGAAVAAAIGAGIVAAPVVWLLPLLSAGTAIAFAVAVGLGVRAGAADVKRGYLISSGD